jgi:ubiquilin
VKQLKEEIAKTTSINAEEQKVIFLGRILENHMELNAAGVKDNNTVFVVRSQRPSPSPAPAPRPNAGGLAGLLGTPPNSSPNTSFMQSMMNSPAMQNILSNPDIIRNMMQNNPQMRALMESNPEVARQLQDPEVLRRAMQAATNPEIMREMTRNNDRTMANIESHPEGFNMLRRMYNEVQEPMMDAAAARLHSQRAGSTSRTTTPEATPTPNASPLPNPWATPAPAPHSSTGMPAGFGFPGFGNLNPNASSLPGVGTGSNGNNAGATNPMSLAALQMLRDPEHARRMTQLMQNPAILEQMGNVDPRMGAMLRENPQMLQGALRHLQTMTPEQLQQMLQMHGSSGLGNMGLGNLGAMRSLFGAAPVPAPAPSIDISDEDFDKALQEAMATLPNEENSNSSTVSNNPISTETSQTAVTPSNSETLTSESPGPSSNRFSDQLERLHAMGFSDDSQNVRALEQTNGNVNQAVGLLLAGDL